MNSLLGISSKKYWYAGIGVIVLIGLALSVMAFAAIRDSERRETRREFNDLQGERIQQIQHAIAMKEELVHNLASLYRASHARRDH